MSDRERILRIEIPGCDLNKEEEASTWDGLQNGWDLVASSADPAAIVYPVWTGTIDLSGYAMDFKTFWPSGGAIQNSASPREEGSVGLTVYTLVSTVPINIPETITSIQTLAGPGFTQLSLAPARLENQNWTTVLFAESDVYVPDTTIVPNPVGLVRPLTKYQTGSLEPTAADTLFVTKIAMGISAFLQSTTLLIPASRVLLPGYMDQEPDLEYMMRIKRSLELANQV